MSSTLQYAVVGTGTVGAVLAQRFYEHDVPALWANTRGPETIDVTATVRLDHTGHPRPARTRRDHLGHSVLAGP